MGQMSTKVEVPNTSHAPPTTSSNIGKQKVIPSTHQSNIMVDDALNRPPVPFKDSAMVDRTGRRRELPTVGDPSTLSDSAQPSPALLAHPSSVPGYPTYVRYHDEGVKDLIERDEQVMLRLDDYSQPILMTPSGESFSALVSMPPGTHHFRFIVRGKEVVDKTQPLKAVALPPGTHALRTSFTATREGSSDSLGRHMSRRPVSPPSHVDPNEASSCRRSAAPRRTDCSTSGHPIALENIPPESFESLLLPDNSILVNTFTLPDITPLAARLAGPPVVSLGDESAEKEWGQDEILFKETRKFPPIIPPHLLYTPLNTPPTPFRVLPDGRTIVPRGEDDGELSRSPEHLPLPLSVTINRIYFRRRDNHTAMGITHRYQSKSFTINYYASVHHLEPIKDKRQRMPAM